MGIDKNLASTNAAPFWIGFFVTLIAAITASGVLFNFKKSSFAVSLDDSTRGQLERYLTRDFDAVQSAASIVSVVVSALLLVHLSSAEGAIAFASGVALIIAVLVTFFRVSPAVYHHYTKGAFTPFVDLLLLLNVLGLVLVVWLH